MPPNGGQPKVIVVQKEALTPLAERLVLLGYIEHNLDDCGQHQRIRDEAFVCHHSASLLTPDFPSIEGYLCKQRIQFR